MATWDEEGELNDAEIDDITDDLSTGTEDLPSIGDENDDLSIPERDDDIQELEESIGSENYDSDDDTVDENYIEKLSNDYVNKHVEDHHPEIYTHNYEEMRNLIKIVRDRETGNIVDPIHKTVPFLTKYERTRVLGLRSKQINNGGEIYVDVPPNVVDGYSIAEIELNSKKIPFIIRRPIPNGGCEYWKLSDLEIM